MDNFTNLAAWEVGLELVKEIYVLSKKLPKEEMFGLTSQVKRSSTSILANLAEGFGRFTFADKAARYTISRGECSETEAHVRIMIALQFVTYEESQKALLLIERERKLLSGLITACRQHRH
jgi:four helix bundle protein